MTRCNDPQLAVEGNRSMRVALHFHALREQDMTVPRTAVVSEHAMRARTSTDPQANLKYRVTAASAMSASLCSLSNIAVGVW